MSGEMAGVLVGLGMLTLLAAASVTDLRSRRIDNRVPAGLLALWPLHLATASDTPAVLPSVAVGLTVLAAGIVLWRRHLLGGGDVKLLAALAVWAGPAEALGLLLITALAGGVLALAWLWYRRIGWAVLAPLRAAMGAAPFSRLATPTAVSDRGLPYGIAIATGGGWLWLRLFAA